jgi:hypothetical protein
MASALHSLHAMKKTWLSVMSVMVAAGTSSALPPNSPGHLRPGANHNTGDDGYVARLGTTPDPRDEKGRIRQHFLAVRERLAAAKPTRPDLETKRKKILTHLDAYIAKGTTPDNARLPWRTPVFIDEKGTICAVGYLIEQTAGRPLAEKIASTHRYRFIEDIAREIPEVRAWIAESGFTLAELGQIQPGYMGPEVLQYESGYFAFRDEEWQEHHVADGTFSREGVLGLMKGKKMTGEWTHKDKDGDVIGKGTFVNGAGTWTSFRGDGKKLAEGPYENNRPNGAWRFFHASGNLAAEGNMVGGQRVGAWRFYYDTHAKTPIATGRFTSGGSITGTWKHFDAQGRLLATTHEDTPETWTPEFTKTKPLFWNVGYLITVVPGPDRIQHQIHTGAMESMGTSRLDSLALEGERVYIKGDRMFDGEGNKLVRTDDGWRAENCGWGAARKAFARRGDVAALNGLMHKDTGEESCKPGAAIGTARAHKISKMVASMEEVRNATPELMTSVALDEVHAQDLTDTLAASMTLDVTWPHVDGRFTEVYATLPGYRNRMN